MEQAMNRAADQAHSQRTPGGFIDVFEHILKNSEDIIMTTDLDGKVVFTTPNVVNLLKCQQNNLHL